MEINSVFAGLNSNVSLYDTQSIFKYILFLTAIDSISGYCSFKLVNENPNPPAMLGRME